MAVKILRMSIANVPDHDHGVEIKLQQLVGE